MSVAEPITDPEVDDLWARHAAGDPDARGELIVRYQPLVKRIAAGMIAGLPGTVERDDLAGYGVFGLIDAVDRFETARGIGFESFAMPRIRGAILDGLRSIDWVPKKLRARTRSVDQARSRLEHDLRRTPTEAEIAAELGVPEEQVARALREAFTASVGALDGADLERIAMVEPAEVRFPIDVDLLQEVLAAAIVELPDRERVVFTLYYVEELTFERVGELLGVSKVRVCQIQADAVRRIRDRLGTPE